MTRTRMLRRVAIGLLATLAGLELGVGLWSYGLWLRQPVRPVGDVEAGVVLVVGDGDCWGRQLGMPAPPWPDRVAAARPGVRLRSGSAPGRDTAAAVRALPGLLAAHRPEFVYLAIGRVDLETGLAVAAGEVPGQTGPFEWRSVLLGAFGAERGGDEAPWFVGDWHVADVGVRFGADGRFVLGDSVGSWRARGDGLRIALADGGAFDAAVRREGPRLVLTGDFPGGRLDLDPGFLPPSPTGRIRAAIDRGDFAVATFLLRAVSAGRLPDAERLAVAAELAAAEGDEAGWRAAVTGLDDLGAVDAARRARDLARPRDLTDVGALPAPDQRAAATMVANLDTAARVARHYGAEPVLVVPASGPLAGLARQVDAERVEVGEWTAAGVARAVVRDLERRRVGGS